MHLKIQAVQLNKNREIGKNTLRQNCIVPGPKDSQNSRETSTSSTTYSSAEPVTDFKNYQDSNEISLG